MLRRVVKIFCDVRRLTPRLADTVLVFFFFQAEDGIRDLVRSRGLGDVYKRQGLPRRGEPGADHPQRRLEPDALPGGVGRREAEAPVSYTHLTLPTSDLV